MTETTLHRDRRLVMMGDTDASGLLYYPAIFGWSAEAFERWLHAIDHSFKALFASGYATPTVGAVAEILAPLALGDVIDTSLTATHLGTTSFRLRFDCVRGDGERAAVVETAHVFTTLEQGPALGNPRIEKQPVPQWFRDVLARGVA